MPVMGLLKLIFTQNDRNNSGFHLCMTFLGLELRLHCYNIYHKIRLRKEGVTVFER
jgi:hypothetical protein